ncbi:MAG: EamA family transporter [Candidatus Latescibacteria bacterium]|nr:EamA family transporter [bacterium]MBD3424148.1 EamA family transporter [Candidatus Latescibacterota bacterium]
MRKKIVQSDLLLILTAAIWGFAFVAQRVGMKYVGPFIFNGVRFALAALFLFPLVLLKRRRGSEAGQWDTGRIVRSGLFAGLFLFAGSSLQQAGVVFTTAGKAGFITGLYVVIVPLATLLFWRERTGSGTWIGAVLAVAGLYLLTMTGDFIPQKGDLLVLAGAFFFAGHVIAIGKLCRRVDPLALALVQCLVCSLMSLGVSALFENNSLESVFRAAIPIIYGGLFSVGLAYTFQIFAQRYAPASHASIIMSFEAVFAVLGGWLILHEVLSARGIWGCALMLAGMILSQISVRRERAGFQG